MNEKMNKRKRTLWLIAIILISALTCVVAFKKGLNPPPAFLLGCVAAYGAVYFVAHFLKIPDTLYVMTLIFVYMASPLGSIMNFYRSIPPYDKIVHFLSGILIAAFGYFIITRFIPDADKKMKLIICIFTFLFASSGAGLWEIFEFTTDKLAGGGMQRGMVDTVTDMIAGNIGGFLFAGMKYFRK